MFLAFFLIGLCIFYFYSIKKFVFFSQKSIKHDPPVPIFGNHVQVAFGRRTQTEVFNSLYKRYPSEKIVGYYKGTKPEFLVRDPEIIKHVLNTNFSEFCNRGVRRDPKVEPLMLNMFSEDGSVWKLLRHNLSPAFSGSKLKSMFPIIVSCTNKLVTVAKELALEGKEFDACILCARFTIDLVGASGFGIDMNTINNEQSLFLKLRELMFIKSNWQMFLYGIHDLFPESFIKKIHISRPQVRLIIKQILDSVRSQRTNDTNPRNDFINLLLELGKVGKISGESLETDANGKYKEMEMDFNDDHIIAQLFIFFMAGFETSSTTMSYAMHKLAFHPEIQQEVQREIDKSLAKHNNKLCYESVSEMVLLELIVKECLRLFPPAGYTSRISSNDCVLPDVNVEIKKGTKIIIPIQGIQLDPVYFENPEQFNPKRFLHETLQPRHKYAYIPFGEGPRKCIGARLGTLETMAGLAAVLNKFDIKTSPSSTRNIHPNRAAYLIQFIDGGLPLRLTLREKSSVISNGFP
ncbi:unnamed protein product [Leptosia nina]|uniref:unspecific monooxygenase n=1 Tax=Leptosia nina TaxID=320188 RepID=A0AAV1J5L9_9NEOP